MCGSMTTIRAQGAESPSEHAECTLSLRVLLTHVSSWEKKKKKKKSMLGNKDENFWHMSVTLCPSLIFETCTKSMIHSSSWLVMMRMGL